MLILVHLPEAQFQQSQGLPQDCYRQAYAHLAHLNTLSESTRRAGKYFERTCINLVPLTYHAVFLVMHIDASY